MPILSNLPEHATAVFDADGVRVIDRGDRLDVVLCTPDNRNAQTPRTWAALANARDFVTADTRAVVVSGEGVSFCAGLDRSMLGVPTPENPQTLASIGMSGEAALKSFIGEAQAAFSWWRESEALTIAVVQGHAIGAGFQLALACDLIVALPDASFAMRESRLGLVPDLGGTHALVRAVGYSRALEICVTGRAIETPEAIALGIAQFALSPKGIENQVDDIIANLTSPSRGVVADLKSLLRAAQESDPHQQLINERDTQVGRISALLRAAR